MKTFYFVYISSPSRQIQRTTEWRNSPNAYLKQEIEETGTPNPKKVTKVNISSLHFLDIRIDHVQNREQLMVNQNCSIPMNDEICYVNK